MAYGQNPFYHSKSLLEAEILNTSLQSEESFGLHVGHTENGYLSREMASEENFTSGLSSLESVLQGTIGDSLRHDGENPVFSLNDHPNDAPCEQTLSNNTSSLMDQNSYEAALEPVLLTMTSVDCYSDISSCSEKDFSWISDICVEKNSIQCSEYLMIESTKDMLIGQVENNSCSFEAEKDVAQEGWDDVPEKQNLDIRANVEEDRSQSDCSNTVMEGDGQGERVQLKLENKCTNPIYGESDNVCALKTGKEDLNKGCIIQHSNPEAATIDTETVCSLEINSTQQKNGNENNFITEDGHVEEGDHLKEETKMPTSNHNDPENLEFEKRVQDSESQYDNLEKKLDIGNKEQRNSFEPLQSSFDMSNLGHTVEPKPDGLCGAMNQIHDNYDINHTGQPSTSQIRDAADEGVQEPSVFNTCNKAQVSVEPGQQHASVEDHSITNIARTECENDTGATGNVLLSSNEFMKKLQPVVLVQPTEWSVKDGNAYQCSVCQQTMQNLNEVVEHHHYKHLQHEFNSCQAYGCYFSTETLAVQHFCDPTYLRQHDTPKTLIKNLQPTYQCQYCNKPFIKSAAHRDHEQRHTVVTKYRCNRCGIFFPQHSLLSSHRRKIRCKPFKVDPYPQLKGRSKMDLEQRNKPTFKVENYGSLVGFDCFVKLVDISKDNSTQEKCPVSGYTSKLRRHFTTRTDDKPFKCDACKECFKYFWSLDKHKREQCSSSIKQSKTTIDAYRGRYACPICSHVYFYAHNVSRHMENVCLKEYTAKGKGKVGTRYKCPLCDDTFSMPSSVGRHIKRTCFQQYKTRVFKAAAVKEEKEEKRLSSTAPQDSHGLLQRTAVSVDKREECTVSTALTCRFCEKRFSKGCLLKKHLQLHKGNRPYRCLACGKTFKERKHLICHKNVHRRKIQCSVCKKIVPTVEALLKHRQSHISKGVLQCPDCTMQFRIPVLFVRHVATHEKKRAMEITVIKNDHLYAKQMEDIPEPADANKSLPESNKTPITRRTMAQEVKINNFCAVCNKTFDDFEALTEHCQTHLPPLGVTKCPFCVPVRHFCSRSGMVRHVRLHTGEKPFLCQKCGVRFRRSDALGFHELKCDQAVETSVPLPTNETEIHEAELGETKNNRHKCSYCPYVSSKRFNVNMHERAHRSNSLTPCSKCGRYYKKNKFHKRVQGCRNCQSNPQHVFSSTKINIRQGAFQDTTESEPCKTSNTGSKSEDKSVDRCPHCSKIFRYRSYLLCHLRTHLNKNSLACKHCPQTFADHNSYLEHEQTCGNAERLSDSQFKCKFCTKVFLTSRSLRRHVFTHNDVRPHQCEACKRSFFRNDHLKRHRETCKGMRVQLEEKIPLDRTGTGKQTEVQESSRTLKCRTCSKTFSKRANLTRHVAFHCSSAPCQTSGNTFMPLRRHDNTGNCKMSPGENLKPKNVPPKSDGVAPKELCQLLSNEERHSPDTRKLQCKYCFRYFKFPSLLKEHVLCHTGEKPFKCENCDWCFVRMSHLKRHQLKCTGNPGLEVLCKSCGGLFTQEALDSHEVSCDVNCPQSTGNSSKDKGFPCSSCNGQFLLFSELQEHILTKHTTGGLQHSNTESPQLTETLKIKDEAVDEGYSENLLPKSADGALNESFKCPQCSLSFNNRDGLVAHMHVHTSKYPLSCKKCNKGFWKKHLLQKHDRICKDVLKKECDLSEQEYKQNDKVLVFNNDSNTTGTGLLQTKFLCKDQDKGEMGKGDAVVHKYQCSECDQSFTDGLRLISHLEAHGREEQERRLGQRHSCKFCDETFDQAGLLQTHVKTCHPSTADNTCLKCSKSFRYPSDLVHHQSFHDPNRPFVCNKCELRYWTAKSLSTHERITHSISETMKTTKSSQRNSSRPNMFSCDPCNKVYMNKTSYQRHCRLKHRHSERLSEPKSATVEQQVDENESAKNDTADDVSASDEDYDSDSAPYFPCHVCGKTFLTSESLEDHQRCHLGEKPFECEECGKCFFQLGNLQQHQRSHKSEFQCQMCGRGFVSLFALRKHKHTHIKKRPHQCPKCALTFTKSSELAEHMVSHRNENFPCDVCHQNFSCKASRAEHRKIHTETEDELPPLIPPTSSTSARIPQSLHEYKYSCKFCQVRFPDPEQLSEHRCKQVKERQYSCTECGMNFLHGSHLKKHQLTHQLAGTGSFQCNTCHMSFSHRSHFLTHLQTHGRKEPESPNNDVTPSTNDPRQEKIYKCPICPESFAQALELANHLSVHSHMCNVCSKTFGTKEQLEIHEQSHLSAATQYECTECGKSFLGSDAFRQHYCANKRPDKHPSQSSQSPLPIVIGKANEDEEDVDVGEDFYNCPTCNKRFPSSISLLEHKKLHEAERPFKCLVCGKDFAQKKYLKKHQAKHDEKSYQCDKCPESFKTESAFASHCKMHDAQRFHCSMCNRSYRSRSDLTKHEKKHSGLQSRGEERGEHRCDMCYKSFSLLSQLQQHQESHIGQVVYECTECDKAFAFLSLLEEHQQTHAMSVNSFQTQTGSNNVFQQPVFE